MSEYAQRCEYCGADGDIAPASRAGMSATGCVMLCQECERQAREYFCVTCGSRLLAEQTPVRG